MRFRNEIHSLLEMARSMEEYFLRYGSFVGPAGCQDFSNWSVRVFKIL